MSDNHKNTLKTAWNDVTGDTINNSLKSDNTKYAQGWDAIFGKKKEEPSAEVLDMFAKIEQMDCSVEAALEMYKNTPPPSADKNDILQYQLSLVNKMIDEMESTPEGKAEMDVLRERMRGGCPSLD